MRFSLRVFQNDIYFFENAINRAKFKSCSYKRIRLKFSRKGSIFGKAFYNANYKVNLNLFSIANKYTFIIESYYVYNNLVVYHIIKIFTS